MAYRKSYYRKDGTYVSDSFDKRKSRKSTNNNKGDGGCFSIIGCIAFFIYAKYVIFNEFAWYWKVLVVLFFIIIVSVFVIEIKKMFTKHKNNEPPI